MARENRRQSQAVRYDLESQYPSPISSEFRLAKYPTVRDAAKRDNADMARFGKQQQLKRSFGLVSMIALTCGLMITWEGQLTVFVSGLKNGGRAGLLYGYLFTWMGNILQVLVMAEMGSMIPLSGGQYNWVAVLAPPKYSRFLSYLTGWTTLIAWQAVVASAAYLAGSMVEGLLLLNRPEYMSAPWKVTCLIYAILVLVLFINTYLARILPAIESMVLVIHVLGFFIVLIPLVFLSPTKASTEMVFTSFYNGGNFSSMGVSFFVGLSGAMFAFIGVDAASHIAEEIHDAAVVIPRSMVISVILNGLLGLGMTFAILFCMGSLQNALEGPFASFPFIKIFRYAMGSNSGATVLASFVVSAMILATIGCFVSASRMTWAFAREFGIPGAGLLMRVDNRTKLPLWSIALTTLISALLTLVVLGNVAIFDALTSLTVAGFYSTFLLAASVMLHKRLTTPYDDIEWGPFKLRRAGVPVTIASIAYSAIGMFFSFWPADSHATVETMNWSPVVFGAFLILCLVFWMVHGRNTYTGPVREL